MKSIGRPKLASRLGPNFVRSVFLTRQRTNQSTAAAVHMAPAVPSPEEVTAYLAAHSLEAAIETAVNDAVLKKVKNPLRHVAEILLKKSEAAGEESPPLAKRKVSLDGPAPASAKTKAVFAPVEVSSIKESDSGAAISGEELKRDFVQKEDVQLKPELLEKLRAFFDKMDTNHDGDVSKDEAVAFWGKNFAKVNAKSMFNEVDEDGNESISWDEFLKFWQNVVGSGYPEEDVIEEVDMMLEGGSWVDFNDGRTT